MTRVSSQVSSRVASRVPVIQETILAYSTRKTYDKTRHQYVCQYIVERDEEQGYCYRYRILYRVKHIGKTSSCFAYLRKMTEYTLVLTSWQSTSSISSNEFTRFISHEYRMMSNDLARRVQRKLRIRRAMVGLLCCLGVCTVFLG